MTSQITASPVFEALSQPDGGVAVAEALREEEEEENSQPDAETAVPEPTTAIARAPKITEKKPRKLLEVPGKREETEKKKRRKMRKQNYSLYVYRVLKDVHPNTGISRRSMTIMDNFVQDHFERLCREAELLCKYSGRKMLTGRDIMFACRLLLPGDLSKHAMAEGIKAMNKYIASKPRHAIR